MKTTSTTAAVNKSFLMSMAHVLVKKFAITLSEALKKAWKACKMKAALLLGVVKFEFLKKDGSVRKATGTLLSSIHNYTPSSKGSAPCYTAIPYYDIDAQGFRSFCVMNLL